MTPIETVPLFDDNPPIDRPPTQSFTEYRLQRLRMNVLAVDARLSCVRSRQAEQECSAVLVDLERLVEHAQDAQRSAAAVLRAQGCTWSEIGKSLGITRQAAQQRWGR